MILLIADDDKYIRYSMRSMLHDIDSENLIVYEAINGENLVEQCRRYQPDVAFVDITMPRLDGLSAIEKCRHVSETTQYVLLTGHSDFCYAQKGIQLQVADYIVKPAEPEQLAALLKRLQQTAETAKNYRNAQFQLYTLQSFSLWDETDILPQTKCSSRYTVYSGYAFFVDCSTKNDVYKQTYRNLILALNKFGKFCLEQKAHYVLRDSDSAVLQFILEAPKDKIHLLNAELRETIKNIASTGAISCLFAANDTLALLYQILKDVEQNAYLRFGLKGIKFEPFEDLKFTSQTKDMLKTLEEAVLSFQKGDEASYLKALQSLSAYPASAYDALSFTDTRNMLEVVLGVAFCAKSWELLYAELRKSKNKMFSELSPTRTDKVSTAIAYMQKNYMQDISIQQLAEKLEVTPNYLSKLFHDQTGKTFSEHLLHIRINQAKRILVSQPDVLIKDIAMMVGYFSSRHFANVFRKCTGVYPSEFRENV